MPCYYCRRENRVFTNCNVIINYRVSKRVFPGVLFNPGLVLAGFRTILPCFQQVNLAWTRDPIKNQHLVSGQLKKNKWSRWLADLSPRYGSRSKRYTGNPGCMSPSTYYYEYGRHVAWLRRRRRRRHRAYAPTSNAAKPGWTWENQLMGLLFIPIWVWGSAWRAFGPPGLL